jgi:non-specific serine/threonine protein kinase
LALIALEQGDVDRAADAAQEALALDRESRDEEGTAQSMLLLADIAAYSDDLDSAARLWTESADFSRRRGQRLELAIALYNLAHVARLQEQPVLAEAFFEESHANFREAEDVQGQAGTFMGLAQIASERGDLERAESLLAVATELFASIRFVAGLLDSLELHATRFERQGQPEAAARLWSARSTLGQELGREADHPLELAAHDEVVARVRAALGDEAFERAWELGRAMTLEQAVTFALEQRPPVRADLPRETSSLGG